MAMSAAEMRAAVETGIENVRTGQAILRELQEEFAQKIAAAVESFDDGKQMFGLISERLADAYAVLDSASTDLNVHAAQSQHLLDEQIARGSAAIEVAENYAAML